MKLKIDILNKKRIVVFFLLFACLINTGCNISIKQNDNNTPKASEQDIEDIINILEDNVTDDYFYLSDQSDLALSLTMMVHYGMSFDNPEGDPGEYFWKKFVNSLILNSWCSPFYDNERIWDNEHIASAGSVMVGNKLKCTAFPENIDMHDAASPYLYDCRNKNVKVNALDEESFEVSYYMLWADSAITEIHGIEKVNLIICKNPESPLNGFSVKSLNSETIYDPVTILDVELEIEQKANEKEEYYEANYNCDGEKYIVLQAGKMPGIAEKYFVRKRYIVNDDFVEYPDKEITEEEYMLIENELIEYRDSHS